MAYKNIHDNFWDDEDVKALSMDERAFLLYVITCRHSHFSGIYHLPKAYITYDLNITIEQVNKYLHTLSIGYRYGISKVSIGSIEGTNTLNEAKFLKYDDITQIIWIKNMLKYQVFMKRMSPQIAASIRNNVLSLRPSRLREDFSKHYPELNLPPFALSPIPSADWNSDKCISVSESVTVSEESGCLKPTTEEMERISQTCQRLEPHGFNAYSFIQKNIKAEIPFKVTEDVLIKTLKRLNQKNSAPITNIWGYCVKILQRDYADFNYALELAKHQQLKDEDPRDVFTALKQGLPAGRQGAAR